jgi:AraC-like DNA-binding protein
MQKQVFSTEFLPTGLDDRQRFAQWYELNAAIISGLDQTYFTDRPIAIHHESCLFGSVSVDRFAGSIKSSIRTPRHIAADQSDRFFLVFNASGSPWALTQQGREASPGKDVPVLFTTSAPYEFQARADSAMLGVTLPRHALLEAMRGADDLLVAPIDPDLEAVQLLRRYLGLLAGQESGNDATLDRHIESTVVDLLALSLGASRDARLAEMRGVRAARAHDIIGRIRETFMDPRCSPREVAKAMGLSPRYVNELMHETGTSFAERVMELRLQQARAMLGNRRTDRMRVSDIALACGFNDVSYFNHCFRRRFGAPPNDYRRRG